MLSQINVLMEKSINSDHTMAASEMFDIILSQIQRSSLNFRLQVSLYSAVISLRDAFKKKKSKLWDIVPKFSDPSPPRPFGTF